MLQAQQYSLLQQFTVASPALAAIAASTNYNTYLPQLLALSAQDKVLNSRASLYIARYCVHECICQQ